LTERGWQVIVLSFPQSIVVERPPLPQGVSRTALTDLSEEQLQHQLTIIKETYGSTAAFIHLHPVNQEFHNNRAAYLKSEKSILKHVFIMAKHLKQSLNQVAHKGRRCFLTVARLDGKFGLGGRIDFGAISAGLFGLTKTLNQEWEQVFCRAIDLSPELESEQSARFIMSELHDPNSLILEVGYSTQGRVTLACELATTA